MRSHWLGRLLRHAEGRSAGSGCRLPAKNPAPGSSDKERLEQVQPRAPKRSLRLCLGIGDGSVHRQ